MPCGCRLADMAKLLRGDSRPVAQNLVASFLYENVPKGVTALMTWYIAHLVSLQGWALPWILLAAASMFLILSVAFHFLPRRKPQEVESRITESRVANSLLSDTVVSNPDRTELEI